MTDNHHEAAVAAADGDELDELLNVLFPFAQQMLRKRGEFHPFAAVITAEGEAQLVGGYPEGGSSTTQELLRLLQAGLQQGAERGVYRATGICADVRLSPPHEGKFSDAVRATLEAADGRSVEVYLPYHKSKLGRLRYGELFAQAGESSIFAPISNNE